MGGSKVGAIRSREEFRALLRDCAAILATLRAESPGFAPFDSIKRQLESLAEWTPGMRRPTAEQKASLDFGVVAARELEQDGDPRVRGLSAKLHDLSSYVHERL